MSIRHIPLKSITLSDLEELKNNQVPEDKVIEYKTQAQEKNKFLAGIVSFVNTEGGDLILGVKEEDGIPIEFCGLANTDADTEINRLEQIIRNGVEPKITGHEFHAINSSNGRPILILRLPGSWTKPHRVKETNRFHARHSNGKYDMDIEEIRRAFTLSELIVERIKEFRRKRIAELSTGMPQGPKFVFHLAPYSAFDPAQRFDGITLKNALPIVYQSNGFYNFDGFIVSRTGGHLQIYRNGCIEFVSNQAFGEHEGNLIISRGYERDLLERIPDFLSIAKKLHLSPPLVFILSFVGVKGNKIYTSRYDDFPPNAVKTIGLENLEIPHLVLEEYPGDIPAALKPAFDVLWNTCGIEGSPNYDDQGNWRGDPL